MKAYVVTFEDYETQSGIYFANKPSQAKTQALKDFDCDYLDLECKRFPDFDKFEPGPVHPKELLKKGWWLTCNGCSERLDEDGYYNEETDSWTEPIYVDNKQTYYGIKGEIFCCQECLDERNIEKEEMKRNKEKAEKIVKERFPEATIKSCHGNPNRMPTYLDFTLPGIKNPIGWNTEDKEYLVSRCDVEKFQEYRKNL